MAVDPSSFHLLNVIDTCAIWNVLSSRLLCQTALAAQCFFSCTTFVIHECLFKPRTQTTSEDEELKSRLRLAQDRGQFHSYPLDIDDLLEMDILERRKRLGKGELASIAFAKRTGQAFHTDDQGARKLASQVLDERRVQTTPQLFGWLYFRNLLGDVDKETIINEHEAFGRPLRPYFEEIYQQVLHYQLSSHKAGKDG